MGVRFDSRVGVASRVCTDGIAVRTGRRRVGGFWRLAGDPRTAGHVDRDSSLHRSAGLASGRYTMSGGRRLLIVGGIGLALWGMGYGLWYAVFAEHQALNGIGGLPAMGVHAAARRKDWGDRD